MLALAVLVLMFLNPWLVLFGLGGALIGWIVARVIKRREK
jgi:hypothetical protein